MDGDVLKAQRELEHVVCAYQLADMPDRVEPGSGGLDFVPLLTRLISRGHQGLVELEHGWSDDAAATEISGIERLREIDAKAAAQAFASEAETRRSEEHTSELQSLMRISYAVFCLKKKTKT